MQRRRFGKRDADSVFAVPHWRFFTAVAILLIGLVVLLGYLTEPNGRISLAKFWSCLLIAGIAGLIGFLIGSDQI